MEALDLPCSRHDSATAPAWLIAGAGILFLSSLFIPFRRMRGEHRKR